MINSIDGVARAVAGISTLWRDRSQGFAKNDSSAHNSRPIGGNAYLSAIYALSFRVKDGGLISPALVSRSYRYWRRTRQDLSLQSSPAKVEFFKAEKYHPNSINRLVSQ
jgi:hypothetical protein